MDLSVLHGSYNQLPPPKNLPPPTNILEAWQQGTPYWQGRKLTENRVAMAAIAKYGRFVNVLQLESYFMKENLRPLTFGYTLQGLKQSNRLLTFFDKTKYTKRIYGLHSWVDETGEIRPEHAYELS